MGLREVKNRARHDLHHAMQVGALYIDPALAGAIPCTVRVHSKWDAVGELKGTSFDYAERRERLPVLIFLIEQLPVLPVRNGLVTITDPATGAKEAYRVDNRHPLDGITVTADVSILEPEEYADLPFPDDDLESWLMIPDAPHDGNAYVRQNGAWVILPAAAESKVFQYSAKTNSQAAVDPTSAKIAWNSVAQIDATELYISERDADGFDVSGVWNRLIVGTEMIVQNKIDDMQWQRFTVNGIIDNTTWFALAVTPVANSGLAFGNNNAVAVLMHYAVGE